MGKKDGEFSCGLSAVEVPDGADVLTPERACCDLCGEWFIPHSREEEERGLCPVCRRAYIRICPYCERPFRTDTWPHEVCPECYEDDLWRGDGPVDEYEDELDCLEDY
ncbi:hypothetical protein RJ40_09785 [Methanofollis aquaemaris]|uniref:Uncharacterized protein n=1 Tax=Methanofollis aquaemaris TaxID=126734 RepID=A0A8A3S7R9_9EURY|nr:hypothetical protein [Methanofollis aquaemaris]QSZ67771.1 hypothetical protein RJ40_09785 [Methanofollis aquaemaris]